MEEKHLKSIDIVVFQSTLLKQYKEILIHPNNEPFNTEKHISYGIEILYCNTNI